MKPYRSKFSIRWMMLFVVLIAIALGIYVMKRRSDEFRDRAMSYDETMNDTLELCDISRAGIRFNREMAEKEGDAQRYRQAIQWWQDREEDNKNRAKMLALLVKKYRYLASHPWETATPDQTFPPAIPVPPPDKPLSLKTK
jgi:hypothetical protein